MSQSGVGPRLELSRPGLLTFADPQPLDPKKPELGVLGWVRVVGADGRVLLQLPTIERGPFERWVNIEPGSALICRMDYWTPRSGGPKRRAIRILGVFADHCLFHPARRPRHLQGCIAPGTELDAVGVLNSAEAMERIFAELGGFEEGKSVELVVRS